MGIAMRDSRNKWQAIFETLTTKQPARREYLNGVFFDCNQALKVCDDRKDFWKVAKDVLGYKESLKAEIKLHRDNGKTRYAARKAALEKLGPLWKPTEELLEELNQ